MSCIKVKQLLNQAIFEGKSFIFLDELTPINIEELEECGFSVVKIKNKFKIMK